MTIELIARNIFVFATLVFLLSLIFSKNQDRALNWAMFYSTLWVLISTLLVNAVCVKLGFWQFNDASDLPVFIPFDILFIWVIA